jgi:methyl-accepting chemotaxis protein
MDRVSSTIYRRKNYFIDKNFQSKFILRFCLLVVIGGLLTIGLLYFFAMKSTTVAFVNSRVVARTTADFILPILVQTVAIVVIVVSLATVFVTLLVSHKIAGPLYRFKKVMQALTDGDFSSEFKIRRLDQLQDLADSFNVMIVKVRQELRGLKDNIVSLKDRLDSISEQDVGENKKVNLRQAKQNSEELNKTIRHFKI